MEFSFFQPNRAITGARQKLQENGPHLPARTFDCLVIWRSYSRKSPIIRFLTLPFPQESLGPFTLLKDKMLRFPKMAFTDCSCSDRESRSPQRVQLPREPQTIIAEDDRKENLPLPPDNESLPPRQFCREIDEIYELRRHSAEIHP